MMLFLDGSVNTLTGTGFGAYVLVSEEETLPPKNPIIQTACFKETSSTRLEIETLLWALSEISESISLKIFTDSQNIVGLPSRRKNLEQNNFVSKNGSALKNAELYKAFFIQLDKRDL